MASRLLRLLLEIPLLRLEHIRGFLECGDPMSSEEFLLVVLRAAFDRGLVFLYRLLLLFLGFEYVRVSLPDYSDCAGAML